MTPAWHCLPWPIEVAEDPHVTPIVEKRCERLLPSLARGCRGWSLPPGVELQDLVQEVGVRWLRTPACTREAADGELLALWFGIARNVLREWRRAAAAERRLRVAVAGVRGGAVAGLGLDLDAEWRGALLRWLCGWMEPEEAAILLGARWDRLTWAEACAAVGRNGDLVVEATQRKILRILSARRLQKSFVDWLVMVGVDLPSFLPSFWRTELCRRTGS